MTVPVMITSEFAYFTDVIMFAKAILMKNMSVEGDTVLIA